MRRGIVTRQRPDDVGDPFAALRARWVARRDDFARFGAAIDGARLCDELLADLETALHQAADELLTLPEAAAVSGYSVDHLGRLIRQGKLFNAGRRHASRIRRADLPHKPATLPEDAGSHIVSDVRRRIVRGVVHS